MTRIRRDSGRGRETTRSCRDVGPDVCWGIQASHTYKSSVPDWYAEIGGRGAKWERCLAASVPVGSFANQTCVYVYKDGTPVPLNSRGRPKKGREGQRCPFCSVRPTPGPTPGPTPPPPPPPPPTPTPTPTPIPTCVGCVKPVPPIIPVPPIYVPPIYVPPTGIYVPPIAPAPVPVVPVVPVVPPTPKARFADKTKLKAAVDACVGKVASGVGCCAAGADCGVAGTGAGATEMPDWDVSLVTDMEGLFTDMAQFNVDISSWNTAKVTNMKGMFAGASAFNKDIGTR